MSVTIQFPSTTAPVAAQIALDLLENKENTRSVLPPSSVVDAVPQGSFSCASAIHLLIGQIKGEMSSYI